MCPEDVCNTHSASFPVTILLQTAKPFSMKPTVFHFSSALEDLFYMVHRWSLVTMETNEIPSCNVKCQILPAALWSWNMVVLLSEHCFCEIYCCVYLLYNISRLSVSVICLFFMLCYGLVVAMVAFVYLRLLSVTNVCLSRF